MQIDSIIDLKNWIAQLQDKIREQPRNALILLVVLVVALLAFVFVGAADASLDLKVEFKADNTGMIGVFVTNTGNKPITIRKITVNNRRECTDAYQFLVNALGVPPLPQTLGVGDKTGTISACQVVWVRVDTDRGSEDYDFRDSR